MKARILITLDVETNLDDDTITRRLEALIDPQEVAALLLEEDDVLELQETTFRVERDAPSARCTCETCKQHDAWQREKARPRDDQREAILEELANPDAFLR